MTREARLHEHGPVIVEAFVRYSLPAVWGIGLARQESDFDPNAKQLGGGDAKRGGSYGLCQMSLMTARALRGEGITPDMLLDPSFNADIAAELVSQLTAQYRGVLSDVLSAYNSGKPWHRAPKSTQRVYVPGVIKYMHHYATWAKREEDRCRQKLSTGS